MRLSKFVPSSPKPRPLSHIQKKSAPAVAALLALLALCPPARAEEPICGRLSEKDGLKVLELWGSREEMGYAHGYLLGERIAWLLDNFILSLVDPAVYEATLIPAAAGRFEWSAESLAELRGIYRGAQARAGGREIRSEKLDRAVKFEDLLVANTVADMNGYLCSSFCVWGELTADGKTLTGRNLDFPTAGGMEKEQIVLVRRGDAKRPGSVGVTWPGLIGDYTAMNAAGVTVAMHDAPGLPVTEAEGFTPRSLTLREALEAATPENFADEFTRVLRARRALIGNNIMVTAPFSAGKPPAVVFEYDGNEREQGATPRLPDPANQRLTTSLICTNHMRDRLGPRTCRRYERMEKAVSETVAAKRTLNPESAMGLLVDVARNADHGLKTLHSVVFLPNERRMLVLIPSISAKTVEFKLDELLAPQPVGGKKGAAAGTP